MQPQATPQHQQLLMKQQQAAAFLSPQGNQQVCVRAEQECKYALATLSVLKHLTGTPMDGVLRCCPHVATHPRAN